MADASCSGPSPFKRLIDHQNRDVGLHQDRLRNSSPAFGQNSFRSNSQTRQGNGEFGTFMENGTTLPGVVSNPSGRLAAHVAVMDRSFQQPILPQQNVSFQQQTSSPAPNMANWAADFKLQSPQPSQQNLRQPHIATHNNQPFSQTNFQPAFVTPNSGFGSMYGPMNNGFSQAFPAPQQGDFDKEVSQWMSAHGGRNMERVDAAMDQMARELELNEAALSATDAKAQEATMMEDQAARPASLTDLETPEIGNLSLEQNGLASQVFEPEEQVKEKEPRQKSNVSEIAGKLVQCVQHEEGDKWKNSVFFTLMRDLRDGRKDVVGQDILPTNEQSPEQSAS